MANQSTGTKPARRTSFTANPFGQTTFSSSKWRYYCFSITPRDRSIKRKRRVTVYCPVPEAASMGAGVHADEVLTKENLSEIGEWFETAQVRRSVSQMEKANFLSALAKNLSANVPMQQTLTKCAGMAKSPYFRGVIGTMCLQVSREGSKLSRAMSMFPEAFDEMTVALIEAGEETGRLNEILEQLAKSAQENLKLSMRLKGVMIYPIAMGVAITALMTLIQFVVIPKLMPSFKQMMTSKMPLSTRIVMGISRIGLEHPWTFIFPVAGLIALIRYRKQILGHPKVQRFFLRLPILNEVLQTFIMLRCLRALSLLLKAVVPLGRTFEITARVAGNVVFSDYFKKIYGRCRDGTAIDTAFYAERFAVGELGLDVAEQLSIAKSTGKPDVTLSELAERLQVELAVKLETLPTFVNIAMLAFFGPLFALVALSIIEPTLQMAVDTLNASRPPGPP